MTTCDCSLPVWRFYFYSIVERLQTYRAIILETAVGRVGVCGF
jgi:hypothetical protein